jgi:hypothetical protein
MLIFNLRTNYSSPYAPARQYSTVDSGRTLYVYDAATLWIAYGLSIFFTLLAVIIGLQTIITSGKSYSNRFSTVVRVARTAGLSTGVLDDKRIGQDPLPKHLKNARFVVRDGVADERAEFRKGSGMSQTSSELETLTGVRREEAKTSLPEIQRYESLSMDKAV